MTKICRFWSQTGERGGCLRKLFDKQPFLRLCAAVRPLIGRPGARRRRNLAVEFSVRLESDGAVWPQGSAFYATPTQPKKAEFAILQRSPRASPSVSPNSGEGWYASGASQNGAHLHSPKVLVVRFVARPIQMGLFLSRTHGEKPISIYG